MIAKATAEELADQGVSYRYNAASVLNQADKKANVGDHKKPKKDNFNARNENRNRHFTSAKKPAPGNTINQPSVCYRCGRFYLMCSKCRFKDEECHKCRKTGHIAAVCGLKRDEIIAHTK